VKGLIKTKFSKSVYTFFSTVLLCISFNLKAQSNKDTLVIKTTFSNINMYDTKGTQVSISDAKKRASNNRTALHYFETAQMNQLFSLLFGLPGGFLIGYNMGIAAGGGKINLAYFFTGFGLIGLSFPFELAKVNNLKKAVQVYNDSLTTDKK
jgi:hypothetical protein